LGDAAQGAVLAAEQVPRTDVVSARLAAAIDALDDVVLRVQRVPIGRAIRVDHFDDATE
jgi:hypothetical protein